METPQIIAIVALGKETHFICHGNDLLWRIPADLKRVKEQTLGYPLIMGRKTYESIGRPLPGRTNIVLTRDTTYKADPEVVVVHSKEAALAAAQAAVGGNQKITIFGGAEIYRLFLPETDTLFLTLVDSDKVGTDKFPEYEAEFSVVSKSDKNSYTETDGTQYDYEWVEMTRLAN